MRQQVICIAPGALGGLLGRAQRRHVSPQPPPFALQHYYQATASATVPPQSLHQPRHIATAWHSLQSAVLRPSLALFVRQLTQVAAAALLADLHSTCITH